MHTLKYWGDAALDELFKDPIYQDDFDVRKATTDVGPVSQEEAEDWKEAYENWDRRGVHGRVRTPPPTEEEIKGWQEAYEFFSNMDFEAVKKKYNVVFDYGRGAAPYETEDWPFATTNTTAKIGMKEKKKQEDVSLIGKIIAKFKRMIS